MQNYITRFFKLPIEFYFYLYELNFVYRIFKLLDSFSYLLAYWSMAWYNLSFSDFRNFNFYDNSQLCFVNNSIFLLYLFYSFYWYLLISLILPTFPSNSLMRYFWVLTSLNCFWIMSSLFSAYFSSYLNFFNIPWY